jgi:hypothetical protein
VALENPPKPNYSAKDITVSGRTIRSSREEAVRNSAPVFSESQESLHDHTWSVSRFQQN